MTDESCLFCRIVAGDIPSTPVYSDAETYAFRDIAPRAPLHVLVVPKRHISSVNELTADDAQLVGQLFLAARRIAEQEAVAHEGYRLVMNTGADAGQSVSHLHLHVLGGRPMDWPPG